MDADMPFRSPDGGPSWLTRRMLTERHDTALVLPPLRHEALVAERAKATAKGRLVEFYRRLALSTFHGLTEPGDEIWSYSDIGALSGSAGIVLLRGRTVVCVLRQVLS